MDRKLPPPPPRTFVPRAATRSTTQNLPPPPPRRAPTTFLEVIPGDVRRELQRFEESNVTITLERDESFDTYVERGDEPWLLGITIRNWGLSDISFIVHLDDLSFLNNFLASREAHLDPEHSDIEVNYPGLDKRRDGSWEVNAVRSFISFVIPPELAKIIERVIRKKLKDL